MKTARGDILIGADGIHSSSARSVSQRRPGALEWHHAVARRTDWPKFLTGRSMVIAGGMEASSCSIRSPKARARRQLTNWAVMAKVGEGGGRRARKTGRAPAASTI